VDKTRFRYAYAVPKRRRQGCGREPKVAGSSPGPSSALMASARGVDFILFLARACCCCCCSLSTTAACQPQRPDWDLATGFICVCLSCTVYRVSCIVCRISTRAARAARPVPRASHNGADGPTRTCRCPSATHPRTQSALPVWQFQPQPRAPAVSSSQPSPRPPAAIGIVSGPVAVQCTQSWWRWCAHHQYNYVPVR
jgi:hypothetical protein